MAHGGSWRLLVVDSGTWWYMLALGRSWWYMVAQIGSWWVMVAPGVSLPVVHCSREMHVPGVCSYSERT